jgi:hypothetical protein
MAKYTLDNLMRVTGEETLTVRGRKVKYYLRTLGHAANEARRSHAMAASRRELETLRDVASLAYQQFIAPISEMGLESLRSSALSLKTGDFRREAQDEVHPLDAPEPEPGANVRELVEAEEAEEKAALDAEAERLVFIERLKTLYIEKASLMTQEELVREVSDLRINVLMAQAFDEAYGDATLYWSIYADKGYKQRLFANPNEAGEADEDLRNQLLAAYFALDAFSMDGDALKN